MALDLHKDSKSDWVGLDDAVLVKAHLKGDPEAFEVLFKKHYASVARLIRSILKNDSLVDDTVQEVFLLVYRYLPKFRAESSLKTWMYRITVNEAIRQLNRVKRWVPLSSEEFPESGAPSIMMMVNDGPSPERFYLEGENRRMVQAALSELKANHRIILTLYYLEELAVGEIAKILEIPEGSVKSRLYYARENLRKILDPMLGRREPMIAKARHGM